MWSQFPPSVEIKWNENLLLIYRLEQKCSDIYCTWHLIHSQHRHCPLFLRHLLSPKERERAILSCRHCISQAHICWGTRGHRTGISPLKRTNNSPVLLLGNFFWDKTSATESNSHRAWRFLCSRKLPHPKLALNKQNPPWTTRSVGFFYSKFQEDWRPLGWRQQSLGDSWRDLDSNMNFPFRRLAPRLGHIWT